MSGGGWRVGGWCVEIGLFGSRLIIVQAHTQAVAAPSLLWPESTTGKWGVLLKTQKEVSVGTDGTQLSDGESPSHPGTFQPEPGFTNTGCLGDSY